MSAYFLCPICGSEKVGSVFFNEKASLCRYGYMPNRLAATSLDNNLVLSILECFECNFAWNEKFEPSLVNYHDLPILEAALHSPSYLDFQLEQALWLSNKVESYNKNVLEIGGGNGNFIKNIKSKSKILYEPSKEFESIDKDIIFYNKYFDPEIDIVKAEIIVMRQVLEHIPRPVEFLKSIIRNSIFSKGFIYIEVPSYDQSKKSSRFYDFYYEHCNYFTLNSLVKLINALHGNILHIESTFNKELNICLFSYNKDKKITNKFTDAKDKLNSIMMKLIKSGKNIAIWGASGNGGALLKELDIDFSLIPYVIDDDKRKQGLFLTCTGQEIVSSDSKLIDNVDCIFIASQLHSYSILEKGRKLFKDKVLFYNLEGDIIS